MSPELRERIYQDVLRAVLWDERREKTYFMLKVNGITGESADEMYEEARRERVAEIRGGGVRKCITGGCALVAGAGLFGGFWYGAGAITGRILAISGASAIFGAYRLLDGALTVLLAHKKKGSIAEEE